MAKHKFTRKGVTITFHEEGDRREVFDSLNLAKRKARALQEANGGLGQGSLIWCRE